jgi:heat-inducible transcriptional repressor
MLDKDEFDNFGMRDLLSEPEFQKLDDICRLTETMDYIDEMFDKIVNEIKEGETKIFIGAENPVSKISNCSMIVSPYKLKDGQRGVLALIGPKRMKYAKNKSLIEYIKKIMGAGSAMVLVVYNLV